MGENVKLLQSMAFYKARGVEGQAPHQDETYIPTRDRSLCGLWIALDDAKEENGCLWVIPGSHRPGIIWPNKPTTDERYAHGGESYGHSYKESDWVCAPVPSGSAILFNGYLLHRSLPNRGGPHFRRALVMHYCSAQSLNPWTNDGRFSVKGEGDLGDYTMVCGEDPYEGLRERREVLRPFVRNKAHGDRLDGEAVELHVKKGGAAVDGAGAEEGKVDGAGGAASGGASGAAEEEGKEG